MKAWMNATSSPDLAYELLVRLCVEQLAAEKGAGFVSAAWVLVESAACPYGSQGFGCRVLKAWGS